MSANAGANARGALADQRDYGADEKAEALRLAGEVGAAEAGRRLEIPAGTLRRWRVEAGEAGPPRGADPADWAARKERGARESWQAAQLALSKVTAALEAGDGQKASKLALSFAILVDKSGVLERAAAAARTAPIVKGEVVDTEPEAPTPLRGDADWEQVAEILFTSGVLRCPRCDGRDDRRDDPPPLPQLPPGAPTRTATTRRTR